MNLEDEYESCLSQNLLKNIFFFDPEKVRSNLSISNEKFEVGEGKSKREAEQAAAKFAYDQLSARTS